MFQRKLLCRQLRVAAVACAILTMTFNPAWAGRRRQKCCQPCSPPPCATACHSCGEVVSSACGSCGEVAGAPAMMGEHVEMQADQPPSVLAPQAGAAGAAAENNADKADDLAAPPPPLPPADEGKAPVRAAPEEAPPLPPPGNATPAPAPAPPAKTAEPEPAPAPAPAEPAPAEPAPAGAAPAPAEPAPAEPAPAPAPAEPDPFGLPPADNAADEAPGKSADNAAETPEAPAGDAAAPEEPAAPKADAPDPFAPQGAANEGGLRTWTDDTGLHQVTARLHERLDGKVRLLKENGRFTTVPLSRLSVADREFLAQGELLRVAGR